MTKAQRKVIAQLRDSGYAVIVWTPEELREAEPRRIEDRSIEFGWDVIALHNGDDPVGGYHD